MTGRQASADWPPPPLRPLLDSIGLGLEQVITYLRVQPDWATFASWVTATAEPLDRDRIARYHAWYDGAPPPAAAVARQAAVMAAAPEFAAADQTPWEADGVVVLRGAVT